MKTTCFAACLLLAAPALAGEAQDIYGKKCAGCHGDDGQGHTRMGKKWHAPNFTSPKYQAKTTDAEMKKTIEDGVYEDGVHKMPAWKAKLTGAQIDELVQLVRAFGKK